jgi:hypothetical protein
MSMLNQEGSGATIEAISPDVSSASWAKLDDPSSVNRNFHLATNASTAEADNSVCVALTV